MPDGTTINPDALGNPQKSRQTRFKDFMAEGRKTFGTLIYESPNLPFLVQKDGNGAIHREAYEELPNGGFSSIGKLILLNNGVVRITTHGEEIHPSNVFNKEEFYPEVGVAFEGRKNDHFNIRINIPKEMHMNISYNLDDITRLPSIGNKSDIKILQELIPKDIPNEIAFLKTLLRDHPVRIPSRSYDYGQTYYEISLVKENTIRIKIKQPIKGKDEKDDAGLIEITCPLSISRKQVNDVIENTLSPELLQDPEMKSVDYDNSWLSCDWLNKFGVFVSVIDSKRGNSFEENVKKVMSGEEVNDSENRA